MFGSRAQACPELPGLAEKPGRDGEGSSDGLTAWKPTLHGLACACTGLKDGGAEGSRTPDLLVANKKGRPHSPVGGGASGPTLKKGSWMRVAVVG